MPRPGFAEWYKIDQTENMVMYLDVGNVSLIDSTKRGVRNLVDFNIPQVAHPDGKQITFQSFVREIEVDCNTHQQKTLNLVFFERINASGREVFRADINSTWHTTSRKIDGASLIDLICIPNST